MKTKQNFISKEEREYLLNMKKSLLNIKQMLNESLEKAKKIDQEKDILIFKKD